MKTVVGVDPGKGGALAAMKADGTVSFIAMPISGTDIDATYVAEWLLSLANDITCKPLYVCIEKVHAMPGQGVTSMFSFGFGTGLIHGVVAALKIPRMLVAPQTWKKLILVDTAKDKNAAVEYVRKMYPDMKITVTARSKKPHSGVADAICIARYGLSKL